MSHNAVLVGGPEDGRKLTLQRFAGWIKVPVAPTLGPGSFGVNEVTYVFTAEDVDGTLLYVWEGDPQ